MNIQRFKWPAIIAASLHGSLFLISSEPETTFTPAKKVTAIILPPVPEVERIAMEPEPADEPAGGPATSPVPPPPGLPESLAEPLDRDAFTVPVTPAAPPITPVTTLADVTGLPFGPGTDLIGPGRPSLPGVDRLDRTPRAVVQPAPAYPEELRRDGADGSVVVEFVVDPEGRVVKAEAVKWSHREFARQAVKAVLRWRFQPGTIEGRPVSFRMAVPIVFSHDR